MPKAVTVVLGEDTLVITLHDALSPAEKVLAQSAVAWPGAGVSQAIVQQQCRNIARGNQADHGTRGGAKRLRKLSRRPVPSYRSSRPARWCRYSFSAKTCRRRPPAPLAWSNSRNGYITTRRSDMLVFTRRSSESVVVGGPSDFEACSKSPCWRSSPDESSWVLTYATTSPFIDGRSGKEFVAPPEATRRQGTRPAVIEASSGVENGFCASGRMTRLWG